MKRLFTFGGTARLLGTLSAAMILAASPQAFADTAYPDRPVRVVVPYPAGGNTDIIAREVAKRLSVKLGQNFIIDNKPGANSIIGTEAVAKAAPDGYTLLVAIGAYANNFALYKKLPYARSDLAPVSQLTNTSLVLVTGRPGITSVKQLVTAGQDKNAPLTFASSGVGSAAHLLGERFARSSGMTSTQHVAYKGSSEAVSDLLAGRVGYMFDAVSAMGAHIKSGRLTALAVTGGSRSPLLPEAPSVREAGYPDMVAYAWSGLLAPAKTPKAIVDKLAATISEVLKDPELVAKLASISTDPVGSTPAEFDKFLISESDVNGKVIKALNISLD
ncbi:Bug family tripartite tricarboxylate transporter substrate binding protein [Ottowia thiooxydans]|uniref:Tripartite-type tricarboxylate transporter receptor subunit TctC n=1 Tax=Ottowia thiooxydans TaxID=219182 RepID=A0ABV2QD25_9BURK